MAQAQKQNKMRSHVWQRQQKHCGDEPPSQRGKKEEADRPPKKNSCKKQESPTEKKLKEKKAMMGSTAPNNKCQHSGLCKRATGTMNSSVKQWALANPSSTSCNKPNLPPTGTTNISVKNYHSSPFISNHPLAPATMTLASQSTLYDHMPQKSAMNRTNKYSPDPEKSGKKQEGIRKRAGEGRE